MSVYVDPVRPCVKNARWKWNESCHMIADTEKELHEFAKSLGLKKGWYQKPTAVIYFREIGHYDLTRGMQIKAISKGAILLKTNQEIIQKRREIFKANQDKQKT